MLEVKPRAAVMNSTTSQSMAAARESLYTGGYLGVVPVLYETLKNAPWMADYPASAPLLVSGDIPVCYWSW